MMENNRGIDMRTENS